MSQDTEFGNYFDGWEKGAPAISWDEHRAGEYFVGVIIPHDPIDPTAYRTTQRTKVGSGLPLFWKPKGHNSDDPFTTEKFTIQPDGTQVENQPVRQAEITILTPFRNTEFMSDKAIAKAAEDGWEDDGTRRVFISGKSLDKALKDAMRRSRVKEPQLGASIRVTLVRRVPNKFEGKTNEFSVLYAVPTAETLKVLNDWVASQMPEPTDDEMATGDAPADPWAGTEMTPSSEPPF